jgi:hypothetical protein
MKEKVDNVANCHGEKRYFSNRRVDSSIALRWNIFSRMDFINCEG